MAKAQVTTDHDTIRQWAEHRGARPATVKRTERGGEAGVLRLDFDKPEAALEEISWDEFFEKFDESDLAFLHQDKTADGKVSRFHKFVSRDSVDEDESEKKDNTSKSKSKSSTRH